MINSADQFFKSAARKTENYTMADGTEFEIKALSVKDCAEFNDFNNAHEEKPAHPLAFLVCRSCDFLTDDHVEEIIEKMDFETLNDLAAKIIKLSGMDNSAAEEAEKN